MRCACFHSIIVSNDLVILIMKTSFSNSTSCWVFAVTPFFPPHHGSPNKTPSYWFIGPHGWYYYTLLGEAKVSLSKSSMFLWLNSNPYYGWTNVSTMLYMYLSKRCSNYHLNLLDISWNIYTFLLIKLDIIFIHLLNSYTI